MIASKLEESVATDTRYPNIGVDLSNVNGNAHALIGTVSRALRRNGVGQEEIREFQDQAKSGDYDNVIQTIMSWVDVTSGGEDE